MRPLSRFFRSAPSAPTRATPVAAPDATLRAAAIGELPDGEILRGLAGLSEGASPPVSPTLERAAQERVAQLIDTGAIDFAGLCAPAGNTSALLSVAGLCGNPDHLPRALALIGDPQRIASLVIEGSSSRIRQLAAQSLEDPAALKQLLKLVRGKDKGIYKIIKQKCDALRAEEQRIAQIESDVLSALRIARAAQSSVL